jgi:hypothetical protein
MRWFFLRLPLLVASEQRLLLLGRQMATLRVERTLDFDDIVVVKAKDLHDSAWRIRASPPQLRLNLFTIGR